MTLRELEDLDISSASVETLEAAVKKAVSSLNPRIKNIGKRKTTAKNAYNAIMESGGLFSLSKTKSEWGGSKRSYRNALEREAARAKRFQKAATGTVSGAMGYHKEQVSMLEGVYSSEDLKDLSKEEINKLISNEWDEFHKYVRENLGSYWTKTQKVQIMSAFKLARQKTGLAGSDLHEKIDEIRRNRSIYEDQISEIEEAINESPRFKFTSLG